MRARMPAVNTSGLRPYRARKSRHTSGALRATGATPFIITVMRLGEMPASVRLAAAAGLTAMIRSA